LQKVIGNEKNKKESDKIYLLTGNPENIEKKLDNYLSNLSPEKRTNFNFIVGTPPVIGGERKLAKLIDYLYSQGGEITNLSKKEYCRLGVNFYDLKLLLKLLKPIRVITLQNSYKYEKFTPYFPDNFSLVENGHCLDFPNQKFSPLKVKESLINLEELLVKQKENLGQTGLLIFLLITQ
jgi:mRNA degradation ribonuclease J1/J2